MKKQEHQLRKTFVSKTTTFIVAAFGFIAALAWNDAVQSLVKIIFGEISQLWAKFIYALIITLIAVIIIMQIERYSK